MLRFFRNIALSALLAFPASSAEPDVISYGAFSYDARMPQVLLLTGEIGKSDSFELRRALREHEIKAVVMGSAGGNLYEGLQMAAILRDKSIASYVPNALSCESSCANMFFGGAQRKAGGHLGVHQFYSPQGDRAATLSVAQAQTQYTAAEVIGILNELDTPPFVYEKMFGTAEIHYFTSDEKQRLARDAENPDFLRLTGEIESFLSQNPEAAARPEPSQTLPSVAASVPPPAPPPSTVPERGGRHDRFTSTDFFGSDILPKGQRNISVGQCEQLCRGMPGCAAWSYVHETRWCWPKAAVENISMAVGITSGVVDFSRMNKGIFDRPFIEVTATDFSGNDILPRGMPHTTLDECRRACYGSSQCTAFTWNGKTNTCYPKYSVGRITKFVGAISGVKNRP
ncbi:PAN domain-containing protein [Falsigemmobacter intermedius]|uniref:Apple domain-containing protein n=1 Tax=Falsigemmobacter intermedius TaxID=1553448 RepID=A0A451GG88_9RHOB|nr:PAN domain-containing protein [Falsigemmobacter intermedius]RWY34925.1 hypothetical protein EP867_19095 [Falsigemmobacter intermedius]